MPSEAKRGLVVPIYKGTGDHEDLSKYRGITLLSVVAKVMAGVLLARLEGWPERGGQLAEEQGGFRKGRGKCPEIVWAVQER